MKQRDQVAMSPDEVAALLAEGRKLQLATINQDGTPHLVAMFYTMIGGQIAFWTYRASLKARNLARDPRLSCLVEAGEEYFELRGVQVSGAARCVADPAGVLDIGRRIMAGLSGVPGLARWRSTWPRPRASGWGTWWNRPGSPPGITASCGRRAGDPRGVVTPRGAASHIISSVNGSRTVLSSV